MKRTKSLTSRTFKIFVQLFNSLALCRHGFENNCYFAVSGARKGTPITGLVINL